MPSPAETRTIAHADDICGMIHRLRTTTFATLRHRVNECEAGGVRKTSLHGAQHQVCHQLAVGSIAVIIRPSNLRMSCCRNRSDFPAWLQATTSTTSHILEQYLGTRETLDMQGVTEAHRTSKTVVNIHSFISHMLSNPTQSKPKRTPERSNSILHIRFPLSR
jgi:hypothetical protein